MNLLALLTLLGIAGDVLAGSANYFQAVARPTIIVSATGIGYPPRHLRGVQARLMARRAAEVVAMRNLAAKLGLPAGARVGPFRYASEKVLPNGAVEVKVEAVLVMSPGASPHGHRKGRAN